MAPRYRLPGQRAIQVERYLTITYVAVVLWILLGRPDLRVQILAVTRRALRRLATVTADAAQRTEDALLDAATRRNT